MDDNRAAEKVPQISGLLPTTETKYMSRTNKKIPYGFHSIDDSDIQAVVDILENSAITQGQTVEDFGQALADYTGAKYGVAVSSGTAALHISVAALGIKPGDEVITTPITFCATANAVIYEGADIKFVDINENTLNIDPNLIEEKITDRTKAIIPVDFRGHPANLPEIKEIADRYNLKVIEDGSHSIGSTYKYNSKDYVCGDGIHVDYCTFSFHPVKHITTGEGGMILTNDEKLHKKCRSLRNLCFGMNNNRFIHDDIGWNYRFTNMQAAIGCGQLKNISWIIKRKREIGKRYHALLKTNDKIIIQPKKNSFKVWRPPFPKHSRCCIIRQ